MKPTIRLGLALCFVGALGACSAWHVSGDLGDLVVEDLTRNLPWRDGNLGPDAQVVAIDSGSARAVGPIRLQLQGTVAQFSVAIRDGVDRSRFELVDYLPVRPTAGDAVVVIPLSSSRAELSLSAGDGELAVIAADRSTATPHSLLEPDAIRIDLRLAAKRTPEGRHLPIPSDLGAGGAIALTLSATDASSSRSSRVGHASIHLRANDDRTAALGVHLRPGVTRVLLQPDLWLEDATDLLLHCDDAELSGVAVVAPATGGDLAVTSVAALIEMGPESLGGADYVAYRWFEYPRLLWIDSRDYRVQADLFRRAAFFVEKDGFRGRVPTDDELIGRTGWRGHNYRAESLAAFFNAAVEQGVPLNRRERELRDLLVDTGTLIVGADRLQPGPGGVLAVSQESPPGLRRLLVIHEAAHGVFYQEDAFRDAMFTHWRDQLAEWEREYWRELLHFISYDPDDEYLMVNEFQAYLLHRPRAEAIWDIGTRWAGRLRSAGRATRALSQPERLRGAIERSARFVERQLGAHVGYEAGALERLYRLP